jgi:uncharacterized protein YndB with AHSA1/START domain
MSNADKLTVATPSDREVVVKRVFDAPRRLVFEAYTNPDLVKRWLYGPDEWPMVECTIDLRVGGAYRYVWRHKDKGDMGMGGVFREIVPGERIVNTELFDQDWTGGETLVTTVFEERDGRTTVTATVLYSSKEARDGALKTGMLGGWGRALERLDELLAAAPAR